MNSIIDMIIKACFYIDFYISSKCVECSLTLVEGGGIMYIASNLSWEEAMARTCGFDITFSVQVLQALRPDQHSLKLLIISTITI